MPQQAARVNVIRGVRAGAALAAAGVLLAAAAPAAADTTTINGAGSTWSALAIEQWRADVANSRGLSVNYQSVGSTDGRNRFISLPQTTDFAVSEIPFLAEERDRLANNNHRAFQYLPIVAGGTALMYNLKDSAGRRIRDLRLSPATIAGIFTGKIRDWSDPAITADYGKPLPATPIIPVVRSDGSGTSAQFAAFLKHQAPGIWNPFAKANALSPSVPVSNYPLVNPLIGQTGSDGIANYVAQPGIGIGAIGYMESGYAVQRNFPVVAVKNRSGAYVLPTSRAVSTALKAATLNADRTQNLEGVYTNASPQAYPISSYSYMIVPKASTDPKDVGLAPEKSAALGRFMLYFACHGQIEASLLGYSPLPKNLVSIVFDAVRNLPAGHPAPPAQPTAQNCDNPQMTGNLGKGADELRGSLPYGSTDGENAGGAGPSASTGTANSGSTSGSSAIGATGAGAGGGTGTNTGASTGSGAGAGAGDPAVYSTAAATNLTINPGSGWMLTWEGIIICLVLIAPLAVAAVRRKRSHDADEGASL